MEENENSLCVGLHSESQRFSQSSCIENVFKDNDMSDNLFHMVIKVCISPINQNQLLLLGVG